MDELELMLTDTPCAQEVSFISDALDQFNIDVTGIADRKPVAVLVKRRETGQILGGITGRSSLGLLFLDLFFLRDEIRGQGLGGQMLALFEAEGRRRNCKAAVLYTISFQAPDFYKKHGWTVFGEVACDPEGTSRVFMCKNLVA